MDIIKAAEKIDIRKWADVAKDLHQLFQDGHPDQAIPPPLSVSKIGFLKEGIIYDDSILFSHGGGFVENSCYLRYVPPEMSNELHLGILTFNGLQVYPLSSETSP